MTKTFHIIAEMEVHTGKNWEYERDVEVVITTEQRIGTTSASCILGTLYPNRTFKEIIIEEV
jgi:hypothetical protein